MTFSRFAAGLFVVACLVAGIVSGPTNAQTGTQLQDQEFLKGAYVKETPGLKMPVMKRTVAPKYTSDAMRAKIQGTVELQVVVMEDGTVGRARVVTSLDKNLGLDQAALAAAKQWTFEAGVLNGQAVPVVATIKLEFRLH